MLGLTYRELRQKRPRPFFLLTSAAKAVFLLRDSESFHLPALTAIVNNVTEVSPQVFSRWRVDKDNNLEAALVKSSTAV